MGEGCGHDYGIDPAPVAVHEVLPDDPCGTLVILHVPDDGAEEHGDGVHALGLQVPYQCIEMFLIVVDPEIGGVEYPHRRESGSDVPSEILLQCDVTVEIGVMDAVGPGGDGFWNITFSGEVVVEPFDNGFVVLRTPVPHVLPDEDVVLVRSLEQVPVHQADLHVPCVYHRLPFAFLQDLFVMGESLHPSGFRHASHEDEVGDVGLSDHLMVYEGVVIHLVSVVAMDLQIPSVLIRNCPDRGLHVTGIHALD